MLDLAAELPAAMMHRESAVLDLGEPAARAHLIAGWGIDEQDSEGTFSWSLGPESSLSFFAAAPTSLTLGLLCKPLVFEGAPDQTMEVTLNGQRLAELVLGHELTRYRVPAPASMVAAGPNRLDLGFGYHRRPRDVVAGAKDERDLAARCYEIELEGLGTVAATPGGEPAGGDLLEDRIELPAGTVVVYYFEHAASAELFAGTLEVWGPRAGDVRLIVRSRSAAAPAEAAHTVDPGAAPRSLRVPLDTAGPAVDRLELAAVVEGGHRRDGWLRRRLGFEAAASGLTLVLPSIRDASPAGPLPPEARPPVTAAAGAGERPNVLIYLIDTLRADHLGVYGYPRPTSPEIDRFAADGVLFENAQAQSSWTRPTVVSLLTGLRPRAHGVNRRQDAVPAGIDTLAELLAADGYQTAGFVTNGNAGPNFGLDQGFEQFRHLLESADTRERHRLSDHLNLWLFDWLENQRSEDRPFFLYAHASDPHAPYTPPEPFRRRFAPGVDPAIGDLENVRAVFQGGRPPGETTRQDLVDLYDAEIAFNDHHFGRLIERLKELGLYESTLIILVADHGEEFLDHGGWEHGITLYGEQLHVPLILKLPGGRFAGTRIAATVGQVDVVPTILELLSIAPPPALDGTNLLAAAAGLGAEGLGAEGLGAEAGTGNRASLAYLALAERDLRSVNRRCWKLILDQSPSPRGQPLELYRLDADRGETADLGAERPFERELLSQILRRWEVDLARGAGTAGEQVEIPDELRRQLEALGYL